jgi:type VI secretion system protein ImpA
MPLRDDLLNPIPGSNPAGQNLYYAPVYDKIKEARRQDDDAPQGIWQRERKVADWPLTIKLISETLATKSKDIQLAAWLTEAVLRREGLDGLKQGLELLRGLIENFWDNLYPEIEDGDLEFRTAPLQWVGDRLEQAVKNAALTRNGLDWYKYKESRVIGYEEDVAESDEKIAARQEAIAEGKTTGEQFDEAFKATPKAYYVQLLETVDGTLESLQTLSELCDSKFGSEGPGFGKLRSVLEEVRQTVYMLLQKKRETEPDEVQEAAPEPEPEEPAAYDGGAAAAPARASARGVLSAEPADREDAIGRVTAAARYIRREDPYSPAPYLMLRGLRWGELRANGASIDPLLLEAPPTEIRQQLKRLALEGNWAEVVETAEIAMGMPCGRGWLDLQRYVCRACGEMGYEAIAGAVKSELRALLADLPQLPELTMMDDTATANAETQTWLKELGTAAPVQQDAAAAYAMQDERPEGAQAEAVPDTFELAMAAARSGRPQEGIELMTHEIAHERSGRGRFHRKVQLAQLCFAIGREAIALPILSDLAAEIEQRKLEEWEAADAVAHPLTLLFRCLSQMDQNAEERQRLYNQICRLDPVQALSCST